jgi:hypothetical protein
MASIFSKGGPLSDIERAIESVEVRHKKMLSTRQTSPKEQSVTRFYVGGHGPINQTRYLFRADIE